MPPLTGARQAPHSPRWGIAERLISAWGLALPASAASCGLFFFPLDRPVDLHGYTIISIEKIMFTKIKSGSLDIFYLQV